jgi:hypothetical protein
MDIYGYAATYELPGFIKYSTKNGNKRHYSWINSFQYSFHESILHILLMGVFVSAFQKFDKI